MIAHSWPSVADVVSLLLRQQAFGVASARAATTAPVWVYRLQQPLRRLGCVLDARRNFPRLITLQHRSKVQQRTTRSQIDPPTVSPPPVSLDLALEMRAFREELSALRADIRELRQENAYFRAAISGCNERLDAVVHRVDNLEQRFEARDPSSYDHLEETIAHLKLQLNERDQDLLLNDVIVSGIPESKAENPAHIIKTVSLKLGVDLDDRDIVNVERLGMVRRNFVSDSSQHDVAERPRPRAIAVRLCRRTVRDELIQAARVRRGLTTADLKLHGQPQRVFVNEHLTRSNAKLFYLAREAGQRSNFKYVWTREGRIYVRKEDGVSAVRIRSHADIRKTFGDGHV
ncbi:hypothetical protein HF086_005603 [Spodoptera exigua]|uniref:FP protein C-terminal domain-containing protein n=1 Tax=Spodoptera exigua TaxID=7107 RepID=A0A922MY05_SPOEX|nr:hypothetical protein HF086_005603 [Spodoptera exigua]